MRNMNTGAAVGPPRKLMTWPIGLVHVSGAPQCHSTWTPIMNTTARPRARSKARTRSRVAAPVIASGLQASARARRGGGRGGRLHRAIVWATAVRRDRRAARAASVPHVRRARARPSQRRVRPSTSITFGRRMTVRRASSSRPRRRGAVDDRRGRSASSASTRLSTDDQTVPEVVVARTVRKPAFGTIARRLGVAAAAATGDGRTARRRAGRHAGAPIDARTKRPPSRSRGVMRRPLASLGRGVARRSTDRPAGSPRPVVPSIGATG